MNNPVVIVGSGVAGLNFALKVAEKTGSFLLVFKVGAFGFDR